MLRPVNFVLRRTDAFLQGGHPWVPQRAIDHHTPIATAVELCGKMGDDGVRWAASRG